MSATSSSLVKINNLFTPRPLIIMTRYNFSSTTPLILTMLIIIIFSSSLLFTSINADHVHLHGCTTKFRAYSTKKNFTYCQKLPALNAEFAWSLNQTHQETTGKVRLDIMFGAKLDDEMGWLAIGVNPGKRAQMVGTRAVMGIKFANGSMTCQCYNITQDTKLGCRLLPSVVDEVRNMSFRYDVYTEYHIINASLVLPTSMYNISSLNLVWQIGYAVDGDEPKQHPATLQNVDSTETIDLIRIRAHSTVGSHRQHLRKVHGILNIIGWGGLLPIGVIIARYLKKFPVKLNKGWWYYLHVSCQIIGYILGTIGWAFGLWLGHASPYSSFQTHRLFAIFIFTFTTLQVLALRLRPLETDEYRKYWDMYHHFLGYGLLVVIAINIFEGIKILKPYNHDWKWGYIGLLVSIAMVFLTFELITWVRFCTKGPSINGGKSNGAAKKTDESSNTKNTANDKDQKKKTRDNPASASAATGDRSKK